MNRRQATKWAKDKRKFMRWLEKEGFDTSLTAPPIESEVFEGKDYVLFRQIKEVQID